MSFSVNSGSFFGIATNYAISVKDTVKCMAAGDITFKFSNLGQVTAEAVGTGDGVTVAFTLTSAPVYTDTEVIYVDSVAVTNYTIDYTTGVVTFDAPPADLSVITADYMGQITTNVVITANVSDEFSPQGGIVDVTSVGNILIS